MVEVILPVACQWQRKGKARSWPPRSGRPVTEVAEAVAAAAEAAERGGRLGALRIGDDLTPRQRRAVLETEAFHGSPPGTVTIGGQRIRLVVRDQAQEDPETEIETQAEGPAQEQEQ